MTIDVPGVARVLGGKRVLGEEIRTLGALRHAVNKGLPVEALHHTTGYVTSSPREAIQLRDRLVPPATRKRRKGRLKPAESERVERIARVMALAEHVWQNPDDARAFLHQPHPLLENHAPLEVAQTELGARQVEDLLF